MYRHRDRDQTSRQRFPGNIYDMKNPTKEDETESIDHADFRSISINNENDSNKEHREKKN